ncbi:choice-of-anchor Q domain-containing protein [Dactylosporangium sp. NPDC051541]|uniref:choice-of-anchor Q domain-containing protein n=1 Tax=Dactylosporangium sp. NPDC051541 TaxID=3363977 RepID=UPI003793AF86
MIRWTRFAAAALTITAAVAGPAPAAASSRLSDVYLQVSGADGNSCTEAAPCASLDRALAAVATGGTIHLGAGDFPTTAAVPYPLKVTIVGAGASSTTLDGRYQGRVLLVEPGAAARLADLTVSGGVAELSGGGIVNEGDLTIQRVRVIGNAAEDGGGIYSSVGTNLMIADSQFAFNQAGRPGAPGTGGAIAFRGSWLSMTATTVNRNTANLGAAGLFVATDYGTAEITNSTIAGNIGGGGVAAYAESLILHHVTITGNPSGVAGGAENQLQNATHFVPIDVAASVITGGCVPWTTVTGSADHDVVDRDCLPPSDSVRVVPTLSMPSLADDGTTVPTIQLPYDSPARGVVPAGSGLCEGTDQRGAPSLRPGATSCDAGAVQTPDSILVSPGDALDFGAHKPGDPVTLPLLLTNSGPSPVQVTSLTLSGGYTFAHSCGATIVRPGQDCDLRLTLRPASGPNPGTLRLDYTDGPIGHSVTIALTGWGVTDRPPVNLTEPFLDAAPHVGVEVTAEPGTWSGQQPMRFAYQWSRCDGDGAGNCVPLPGDGTTYTPTDDDLGNTLQVTVTAINSAGKQAAVSSMWLVYP